MRIWGIDPRYMCPKHTAGVHGEIHKHLPHLYRGVDITGRMEPVVQIELWSLQYWHDECAKRLNHKSPLVVDAARLWLNYPQYYWWQVDLDFNFKDLAGRCGECRRLMGERGSTWGPYT